jgi:hypothetical protein
MTESGFLLSHSRTVMLNLFQYLVFVLSHAVMLNSFQYLVFVHSHAVMLNLFQYLVFVDQVQILKRVQDDGIRLWLNYS